LRIGRERAPGLTLLKTSSDRAGASAIRACRLNSL
jgi:hypothetical protein